MAHCRSCIHYKREYAKNAHTYVMTCDLGASLKSITCKAAYSRDPEYKTMPQKRSEMILQLKLAPVESL